MSGKMISFSFTIPKKDLLAHVQQTPGAPTPTSPEYLIVDQSGQNCTGTFKMGAGAGNDQVNVKGEASTSWGVDNEQPEMGAPVVKAEPNFNHNDSGFSDTQSASPVIKAEPGLELPVGAPAMNPSMTSTPVKHEGVVMDATSGKNKCTFCGKLFATKAGATKHVASQHKSA